jgi:hypothetical protein
VRGADFWWPKLRTFGGHQCGPLMAISADFFVAMDKSVAGRDSYDEIAEGLSTVLGARVSCAELMAE